MLGPILDKAEHQFSGGLVLPGHKLHGEAGHIIEAPLPSTVIIPLAQHIGAPAKPVVAVGDTVGRGQIVGEAVGYVSAPVHATTSGRVVAIEPRPIPHPSGLAAPCIVIEADGLDTPAADSLPSCEDYTAVDRSELRARVRSAGIVGLGGATFPTSVKLNPGGEAMVDTLILNGAECEPYISCDAALMGEYADEVIRGADLIRHIIGARDVLIGIEDNIPHVAGALVDAINALELTRHMAVRIMPTRYPQGGEKQLIESLTGLQVPSQGLPLDIGLVVHNVGTAYAVWRAVRHGEPLISRVVTVTGGAVAQPHNVRARIGTPIQDLLDFCGGLKDNARLIMGGPMMGFALPSVQCPVVKGTNCILAQTEAELRPQETAMPCIRCGECMDVCPAGLLPQQLYWHARAREFDKTQALNLFDCIECGCCAQVCPSHIPLVQYYRYAKTEIFQAEAEKRKSDHARNRHEYRLERLEREKQEKEEARRRKREALSKQPHAAVTSTPKKPAAANDAIAAAIAKAKAEKARRLAQTDGDSTPADTPASDGDAIAAAIAKAKAAKAAKPATATGAGDDPVAAAIARAKAAKAAKETQATPQDDTAAMADGPAATADPVAAAIARAKAAKAAKAAQMTADGDTAAKPDSPATADDPVAAAIAKAKAARAAKAAQMTADDDTSAKPDSPAATDDPVAAAIARAKAARAARAAQDDSQ